MSVQLGAMTLPFRGYSYERALDGVAAAGFRVQAQFHGGWIIPGLVDAHCHVGMGVHGQDVLIRDAAALGNALHLLDVLGRDVPGHALCAPPHVLRVVALVIAHMLEEVGVYAAADVLGDGGPVLPPHLARSATRDDNLQPIFNNEAGAMTAEWMKELYEKGAIPKDTTNLLWPEVAQNFCDGKVAFYLEWYGWYSYFQDPESCKVAGLFDLMRGPTGAANDKYTGWAGAHAFSIPKAAENKEAAAQLIKFLSSERVAYDESKLGLLPVQDKVWARIIADASSSSVPLDKKRLEIAQQQISEDFFTPPLFADWISFTNLWYPALQGIILGDTDVETGLNDAVEQTRTMMEDAGYYAQ